MPTLLMSVTRNEPRGSSKRLGLQTDYYHMYRKHMHASLNVYVVLQVMPSYHQCVEKALYGSSETDCCHDSELRPYCYDLSDVYVLYPDDDLNPDLSYNLNNMLSTERWV